MTKKDSDHIIMNCNNELQKAGEYGNRLVELNQQCDVVQQQCEQLYAYSTADPSRALPKPEGFLENL